MTTQAISTEQRPMLGLLFVVTAALGFSAKAIIIKIAYGYGAHITPIMLLTLRMLFALPFFLFAIVVIERSSPTRLTRRDAAHLIGLGVIGFYLASYFDFVGLSYISASLERLILLLYPTLVVLMSALFLKRAISTKEALSLVVSYIGIVIVFYEELSLAGSHVMLGSAFILASATAFAIYLMGSGEMVKRIGATRFTAYAMSIACLATLVHFGSGFDNTITQLPSAVYGLALLMAIFSTVIPTFLMNMGIKHIGASPASIISALGPIMTIFLAFLILDEQLTKIQTFGAALVMVGVFIVSGQKRK